MPKPARRASARRATHERELIVTVPEPAPNEALVYMLT